MQVTYIYNLLVYKWSKELIKLNTQIFKLVLILIEDKKSNVHSRAISCNNAT